MKYLLRFLVFAAVFLAVVTALVGIGVFCFRVSQAMGHVSTIVSEGMEVRAANILMPNSSETGDLSKYFTTQAIEADTELTVNAYTQDRISGFDHRVKVESLWAYPWNGTATMTLVETVNTIRGTHPTGDLDETGAAITEPCAPWEKRRYRVTCVKLGNRWMIDGMEVVEVMEPDPTPTKEPVLTPAPTAEPTPAPAA